MHHSVVSRRILSRMHVRGAQASQDVGFDYLPAVLVVEGGSDDLQAAVAGLLPWPAQLPDGCIRDGVQRLGGCYDAEPKMGVFLSQSARLAEPHLDLLAVFAAHIAKRAGVQLHGLQALDVALPDRLESG